MATLLFSLRNVVEFVPAIDENLRFFLISVFETKIAIGTYKNLLITDGSTDLVEPSIEIILEFNEILGRASVLKWLW